MPKKNPIMPRNAIKAMNRGWTGFPTWAISPTISAHELMGNPPRPIPEFGYHFTSANNLESIRENGLRAPVYLFYPDSNYHAWVLSGQIDGVFEGDNPDMMAAGVTEKMFNLIMLRVRFDKSEFLPAPYETGDVHDEFYLNSDVSPDDIAIEGTFAETVGHDLMTGAYTPKNIGKVPNMKAIVEGYFTGDPDHLRPNPPGVPKEASELSIERKKEIRKKWKELVNMTATELQTFYDSDLGNKKAGLSREEAQEAGISSGRDSALAIIKMKQTPVKEWHKRHSKDRGRGIMLDFWQWAQKQINFNTRHRGMRGPYLDEKGRPTRKLLGLWIWGHDPWRYALKVKKERLPMCPNVPWVGSKEKKAYGVLPKENPVFKVILGDIVTISGPSSSGKSTIAKALSKKLRARMVPSYMTREPRPSEEQGVDGIFVSAERFEDMIAAGNFTTKEGVDLWVRQKNGEYYGRKATDFMGSQPAIVDVNFEGLRLMRKAFPDRIYSVFIRTNMGPKRRRENLEKRGVHTEEEIESRVRAGTGMLETFQNLNFDFIARNKFGELNKNVAMIGSEFNKWGGAKSGIRAEARKKKQKGSNKICPHPAKLKFKSREAAFRKLKEMHPDWEYTGMSVYPCGNHWHYGHNYKTNPIQTLKKGTELLHKPTGMKYTFIEPRIDDDGTWYILKDTDSGLSNVRFEDLEQFYSLYPQSPMYIANPANQDQEEIVRRFIQSLDPSIEFDAKALELRLGNAGYKRYPNSRQIGRMLKKIHGDGLIVKTSFSGASSYRNSERNFALNNPPLGLRAIIEASIGKKGLLGVIEQANKKVKRPIRPKMPPNMMGKKSEAFGFELAMRRYKNKLRQYKHGMKKINKYYGYSGTSGKSLVSKVIDAIEEEFKGKPTLTAYRGIFAFKSDEASIVKWITTFGAGDYYSTWKRGADIYFGEFAKQQNWVDVPGAVAWFITSEISILDINWARTLRNRIYYPEEKELSILDSKSRPRRPIIVKRVDVYDLNQSAKYAKSDSTGVKHQPWLSNKIQPIASHEFNLKANPPVFDGEGAMDMGFQHEGKTRYHGHPLPGGTEIPGISGKWKKKSFPSGSEMPLRSKQEADGSYTMGFLERFEGDDRPYIVSNKIDGDSSIAHFDGKETVLWNKRGRWRKDFHLTEQITASLQENGVSSAIILGELYAVDEKGDILPLKDQKGVTIAPKDINTQQRMRFAAYDMAQINGKDVQDEPYASRMEILKPLIRGSAVKVVQSWRSRGGMEDILVAWNEVSKNPHFEGLVVRFDGDKKSYKVKMTGTADLAVIGFYRGKADGRDENIIGGGTLAWMDEDGNYVVAGNSVIGESIVEKDELLKRLLPTAIDAPKVKWGDHMVDRSVTHDHRGKGTITAIEPFLIGEFKYRSINYSEKPVYRLENDRFVQVGTKRAPTLFQASFGRWRPDKELTPHDLRMGQVAAEGQGKWKKNPVIDSGGRLSETDFFSNPPDDTDYPGGTAQYMMDGLLLGSLKERMGDWRTGGNSNLVTRKNWALKYPELAARLEEAQKRGWSYTGPPLPKMKENPTQDELHQKTLDETGFWGAQGAGAIVMARSTGRFLLPLRSRHVEQPGTWGVWGGAIDANEVPATAAKREIVEEAGYEGEIEIVPLVVFESGSFRYHNHLAIVEEEFTPQLNWETERAEWFEFEDFPQPLHFGLLYMLENSTHLIDDKYWLANPPTKGVKWDVKYRPFKKTDDMVRLMGPNLIIKGVHPDGKTEVELLIAIYELGERFKKVTKPDGEEKYLKFGMDPVDGSRGYKFGDKALARYDWIQSQGFENYGHIQGIGVSHPNDHLRLRRDYMADEGTDDERMIHVGAGKGMGQAAYLHAAKVLAKRGIPLVSVHPSESATRAWDKLEENLPPNYHLKRAGLSSAKVKTSRPARLLWYDGPFANPPATDIKWTVKISPNLPEEKMIRYKNKLASWILLTGKNADGEIKMILSVFKDLKGLVDLYPSLFHHKTKTEKLGLNSLAMVEQIETKSKGKGLGQAAYLKAAEIVSKKFSGVIATGNHSLDAEKAWRGVEKHSPEDYKIVRWIGGEYPKWESEDPFNYHRLLWYDGPLENPMAPGYQSYGWTTQDWRSIKVNNKGEIDYSEKCGAEGTQTASGKPRLCLPAIVVKSLIRTESGKEVIRKQARKKARAKKGERIPWHPRIKKLWKKLEEKTVEDRPKKNGVLPVKHGGRFATPSFVHDDPNKKEEELHNSRKQSRDDYDESVKAYMRKNLNRLWKWDTNFKEGADGVKEKAMLKKAKAHAKKEVGAPKSCNSDCLYCAREQWKKNPSPLMRIPKIVLEDKITPAMLDSKSQIFLFGDNEQRKGKGGQAKVMRGHAKAYGIRTKRAPSMSESAFWTDKTYKSNIKMMADDFLAAFMAASDGDHELVIPSAGIGTGMAQLKQRAPRTYKWLNSFLRNLIAGEDPALLKQWRMN